MDKMEKGHSNKGHETRDIAVGKVAWVAVGLLILTALGALVAYLTFQYLVSIPIEETVAAPERKPELPPQPRLQLQVQAVQDLNRMKEDAEERLNSYGWSDPANELARIPIDRAMDILIEKANANSDAEDTPAGEVAREP